MSETRTHLKSLLLGAALVAGGMTLPAAAQFWHAGPDFHRPGLSAHEIVSDLRDEGFRRLSPPVRNRDVYVLDAIDPYDVPVRVIVSVFDGRILAVHPQRGVVRRPVEPFIDEEGVVTAPPKVTPRPPKQALAQPPKVEPPKSANPALTPKNPTVVRTSPLAIPKDKDSKPAEPKDPQAAMPGSKTAPRVIPMAPAAEKSAPVATPEPKASPLPPPAILDDGGLSKRPTTPTVPPAALE